MNKLSKILNYVMMIAVVASLTMMTSCKKDEPVIKKEEGIPVADGFYITESGVDPTSSAQLVAESVEDDGFGAQSRDGYFANYVYLKAGNHTIVNIVSKKIIDTFGGSATAESSDIKNCETLNYTLVKTVKDGAAFAIATDGLYKVTYDKLTNEAILVRINKAGIIGSGTTIGWSDGETVDLPGTVDASGATWEASNITLRQGAFKLRFNCNWFVDRRIDPTAGFLADNGYMLFTNFGADSGTPISGTNVNLSTGNDGVNIGVAEKGGSFPDEGVYTITTTWTGKDGFKLALERTGDAEKVSFDPADFPWGIIGGATQGIVGETDGWKNDKKMAYKKDGNTHIWRGVFPLDLGEFKFRTDDTWSKKFTPGTEGLTLTSITVNTADGSVSDNSADKDDASWFVDANPGFYYFEVKTSDDGATWDMIIDEASWGVIGSATPDNWDSSTGLLYSDDLKSASASVTLKDGELKFRVNDSWDYSLGGTLDALIFDSPSNISYTGAASKVVTITTVNGGESYSATLE